MNAVNACLADDLSCVRRTCLHVRCTKGNKAAKSGQTDQAQYHYVKALENHADTSTVMYNLGNAMYDSGEFERAHEDLWRSA